MACAQAEEPRDLDRQKGGVMAQSITSLEFPVVCPTCGEKAGLPVGTSDPTRVVITVMISCSRCSRMWTQQAEQPPIITPTTQR
jgi:hypothetical protein